MLLAATGCALVNFAVTESLTMLGIAAGILIPVARLLRFRWSLAYLFWLSCTLYMFAGMAVFEFREAVYFNFDGDVTVPYNIWFVATIVTAGCGLLGDYRSKRLVATRFAHIRYQWVAIFGALGVLSAVAIFSAGVPLLAQDVSQARSAAVEGSKGIFWSLYTSLQVLCAILLVRTLSARRPGIDRAVDLVLIVGFAGVLSLYGGRFFVFFPFLFCVAYLYSIGHLRLRSVMVLFVTLLALSVAVSASRFSIYASSGGDSLLFMAVRNDLFPEARTLVQLSNLVVGFDSTYFFSPFVSFLPSAFYDFLGLDKQDYLLSIGKYLNSFDAAGEDVGYRVTFLGEAYLAFGYVGVVISVAVINVLSVLLNRLAAIDWFSRLYIALFGALLIPYGVTFVRSSIVMIPLGLLIIALVRKKDRIESADWRTAMVGGARGTAPR